LVCVKIRRQSAGEKWMDSGCLKSGEKWAEQDPNLRPLLCKRMFATVAVVAVVDITPYMGYT
jgi:hypothetical protein